MEAPFLSLNDAMDEAIQAHSMCPDGPAQLAAIDAFWDGIAQRGKLAEREAKRKLAGKLMQERLLEFRRLAQNPLPEAPGKVVPGTAVPVSRSPAPAVPETGSLPRFTSVSPGYEPAKPDFVPATARSAVAPPSPAPDRPAQPAGLPQQTEPPAAEPPRPHPVSRRVVRIAAAYKEYLELAMPLSGVPGEPKLADATYGDLYSYCDDLERRAKDKHRLNSEDQARLDLTKADRNRQADSLYRDADKYRRLAAEAEKAGVAVGDLSADVLGKFLTRRAA